MTLGERIQKLRKDNNHSQEQLAEALAISRQAISKWESNQGQPEINNIIKLAEIYNTTTDYILLGKEEIKENIKENIKEDIKEDIKEEPVIEQTKINKKDLESQDYTFTHQSIISSKAISIIAIISATAFITVCFITCLKVLAIFF